MSRLIESGFVLNFFLVSGLLAQAPAQYQGSGPSYSGQTQDQYANPSTTDPYAGDTGQAPPTDEPGPSVARLSVVSGGVSVRRGDSPDPVAASLNAPVLAGDTIAVGGGGRAEVQFDFANRLRLGNDAEARIAEMQPGRFHVELARGTSTFSVFRDSRAQVEISTPNVSIHPVSRGLYRVWVRDDGQTVITVRAGETEIYTQRGSERLRQGQTMFIRGTAQDPEYQTAVANATDEWDSWNEERDRFLDRAKSYQYVNQDVTGAEDLDSYGQWVNDSTYGHVWSPRVAADWAPYGDGRFVWEDYYGWTWLSNDPWGWAPYHYGSWFFGSAGWCWSPGSLYEHTFWRPALVGFFGFSGGGGFGFGLGFGGWGNVGWVPLAPYERFVPWYGRGGWVADYGNRVHITNVNISNTYINARVGNALHGVDAGSFTNGRFSNIARLRPEQTRQAGLVRGALPLTPTANNLRFNNQQTAVVPHAFTGNSHFYSRTPVAPVQRTSFQQQQQLVQRAYTPGSKSVISQSNNSSNWSRFGTPNRVAPTAAPVSQSQSQSRSSSAWGRFGSAPAPVASAAPQRYGNPSTYSQNGRYSGQGSPQSLRIAPPIVHERAYDQPARPAYSAPSYNTPRYNTPSYNSPPRYATPTYNAPRYSPPSYSAPRYSAPSPRYSAPSPSYSAPSPRYSAPPQRYSAPSGNYSAPSQHYSAPPSHYSAPSYSAPPSHSGGGNGGGGQHHGR